MSEDVPVKKLNWLRWTSIRPLQSSNFLKLTLGIPLIGYLLVFNDTVTQTMTFDTIAQSGSEFLTPTLRLRFIYFGLISLAASATVYAIYCPKKVKSNADSWQFRRSEEGHVSFREFLKYHEAVLDDPAAPSDKPYGDGNSSIQKMIRAGHNNSVPKFLGSPAEVNLLIANITNYDDAFAAAPEFTLSTLERYFDHLDRKNQKAISATWVFSLLGVLLLSIPSLELFSRICADLFLDIL